MGKESKKKYKQFTIESIEDACGVLASLITEVSVNMDKYVEYTEEAISLLENEDDDYVDEKAYYDINDKLLFRQREILKVVADCQTNSFSYKQFRKLLQKKNYITGVLDEEIEKILSEFLDVRNWTFHNPQSLAVAKKEVAEKNIPDWLKGNIKIIPQLNPVYIGKVEKVEIIVLASLVLHAQKRIEQFNMILQSMKQDYQKLYDSITPKQMLLENGNWTSEVQYIEFKNIGKLKSYESDVTQISMAIQKSKYDGSDEEYKKWTFTED